MTAEQSRLLAFLGAYIAEKGYSPSYEEMAEHLNVVSKANIHRIVSALEKLGKVRRIPHTARSVEPTGATPQIGSLADRLVKALMEAHGFDDGDDVLMCATEAELRSVILAVLARTDA